MITAIVAFVSGFLLDFSWAKYVSSVGHKNPLSAANWAVLLFVVGLVPPYLLIEKQLGAVICFGCGCWIGTYLATR